MFNFKAAALKSTTLSELMNDRVKVSTDEIISQYPNGVTIEQFDSVTAGDKQYYIATIKEDSQVYINCGTVLSKVFDAFVAGFDGDVTGASAELKNAGGIKVKLSKTRTHGGNTITTVTVL